MNAPNFTQDAMAGFSARTGSASLPPVLDACCGSRMFWFDHNDARALFLDQREGEWKKDYGTEKTKGRSPIVVRPDVLADFTAIPFPDESFSLVVFDPPHHTAKHFGNGENSIIKNCYGVLLPGWEEMLAAGFAECFRVLKLNGTLIFKWGSREIPLARVLALTPHKPLFGHKTGTKAHTHWCAFLKLNETLRKLQPTEKPNALDTATAQSLRSEEQEMPSPFT